MFIKPDPIIMKRGAYVLGGAILLWALLIVRLFWLQIVSYDEYHREQRLQTRNDDRSHSDLLKVGELELIADGEGDKAQRHFRYHRYVAYE